MAAKRALTSSPTIPRLGVRGANETLAVIEANKERCLSRRYIARLARPGRDADLRFQLSRRSAKLRDCDIDDRHIQIWEARDPKP